eukprot:CAMPEP_0119330854 /NCGR_PEP_ID=MMETSP1333-20130426/79174_1 /TAXON_ID=418940 /ORGANISM="Scyphosphaera apsteinii, Strain RCC1455" /LENGTH=53 /DNA_ID=CAMNT_0007340323 /DNA_START=16 /DNA_END=173 /DNA_ORIENTATION=-
MSDLLFALEGTGAFTRPGHCNQRSPLLTPSTVASTPSGVCMMSRTMTPYGCNA